MRGPTTLLLLILSLTTPAFATKPFCALSAAFLSASETPPQELIRNTYSALWEELGGAPQREPSARAAVNPEDPFRLAADNQGDFSALGKRLAELKKMLEQRGWNTPQLRAQLLADWNARNDSRAVQQKALDTVLDRSAVPHRRTYPTPPGELVELSANGCYFLYSEWVSPNELMISILDRQTGKIDSELVRGDPRHALVSPKFSQDGTKLILLSSEGPGLKVYPVVNGAIQSATAYHAVAKRPLSERAMAKVTGRILSGTGSRMGNDPNRVVVSYSTDRRFFTYDLLKKTGKEVKIPGFGADDLAIAWGFLPGTDRLYLLIHDQKKETLRLDLVDFAGDAAVPVASIPQDAGTIRQHREYRPLVWTPDGQYGFSHYSDVASRTEVLQQIDLAAKTVTPIDYGPHRGKAILAIAPHPKENLIGALFYEGETLGPGRPNTLSWYDFTNKKWIDSQPTVANRVVHTPLFISPDGHEVILTDQSNKTFVSLPIMR